MQIRTKWFDFFQFRHEGRNKKRFTPCFLGGTIAFDFHGLTRLPGLNANNEYEPGPKLIPAIPVGYIILALLYEECSFEVMRKIRIHKSVDVEVRHSDWAG